MKIKVGPMAVNYQGTARLAAVDEEARTVDIEVRAKEAKGQGTAAAVIRNTLVEEPGGTRVIAETDLQVTGRQAQFGRGIMEDVASRMLGDFARRLESYLVGEDEAAAAGADGGRQPRVQARPAARRGGARPRVGAHADAARALRGRVVAGVLLLALLAKLIGQRRRGISVRFGIRL